MSEPTPLNESESKFAKELNMIRMQLWRKKLDIAISIPRGIFQFNFGIQIYPFHPVFKDSWLVGIFLGPISILIEKEHKHVS